MSTKCTQVVCRLVRQMAIECNQVMCSSEDNGANDNSGANELPWQFPPLSTGFLQPSHQSGIVVVIIRGNIM